jgi:hypothetical protein
MWDQAVQKTRHSTDYRISLSGCLERVKGEFFKVFIALNLEMTCPLKSDRDVLMIF